MNKLLKNNFVLTLFYLLFVLFSVEGFSTTLQAEPQTKPQAELQSESQADLQTESQTEPQAEPQAELQSKSQADLQAKSQTEPQTEPQAESQADLQTESQTEPQANLQADLQAKSQTEPQADLQDLQIESNTTSFVADTTTTGTNKTESKEELVSVTEDTNILFGKWEQKGFMCGKWEEGKFIIPSKEDKNTLGVQKIEYHSIESFSLDFNTNGEVFLTINLTDDCSIDIVGDYIVKKTLINIKIKKQNEGNCPISDIEEEILEYAFFIKEDELFLSIPSEPAPCFISTTSKQPLSDEQLKFEDYMVFKKQLVQIGSIDEPNQ